MNYRNFLGLTFAALFSVSTYAQMVDRVVAVVNSEIVTDSDLKSFNKKVEQSGMIDDLLLFGQNQGVLKNNRNVQLSYLISEKILDSEIKRLNLSVTLERVEQEIRDIAKRNGATRADLLNAIKAQGMSASDYQDFIKTRIERQSLIEQEISSKIRVSDEDVMAQFTKAHPNSDAGIPEFTLAHIVFNSKKGGLEAAQKRAEAALTRLRGGESFETVAEQTSEDSNFANGGLLGTFKAGEFNREMELAIQGLQAGEISKVLPTRGGVHIVKVLSRRMISDPRFDAEKEKIRSQLFEVAFQKHFKSWLDAKREESFVRIN